MLIKYIRTKIDKDEEFKKLIKSRMWNKPDSPKLIISVMGGESNDAKLTINLSRAFTSGLGKVARSIKSWIITSESDQSISNLMNTLINREKKKRGHDIIILSVSKWKLVEESLQVMVS